MITVPPTPSVVGGGPVVIDTQSPFFLQVHGEWLHLQGVSTGSGLDLERPSDELTSTDGVVTRQQAVRPRRTWELEMTYATGVSIAVLRHAVDVSDVWLLDRDLATQNMLEPRACYGAGSNLLAGGIPLPRFTEATSTMTLLRRGVASYAALWTDAPEGTVVGTATYPGGTQQLLAPAGTTAQRAVVEFTPDADGALLLEAVAGTTGLQVTEDWLPDEWLPGQRIPVQVAVTDPARTLRLLGQHRHGRSDYGVTLREVG